MTSVTISTIRNSCIVNNTNIAVQNVNSTPLDAINNWWGMPMGASDQNRSGGDLIGTNILSQPHLTTIPPNCDLSDANWIPFNEQELQFAIQSNLPYLNGLDFALLDIIKGQGAKFTLVAKPIYGGADGEAFITITPAPDGSFIRIMLDISQLPTDPNLSKIAICELMPLFMNSLQHVQNKFTNSSQMLEQMVVMDSALMLLFSPPTQITPEPTPELVLNYDASCLPNLNQNGEATAEPSAGESLNLVSIPPLEGEFTLLTENNEGENQPEEIFEERMLFFQPGQSSGNAMFNMYSARPVTSGDADIQQLTTDKNVYEAALSPDGRYIALIADDFTLVGDRHIFVMRSDGSHIYRITETDGDYFGIGWMPEDDDSQHITYSLGMDNTTYWIGRTGIITSTTIHTPILVDGQPMNGTNPKWSPYQEVIYLSSLTGYVYKATWQDATIFDLIGTGTINTNPMSIRFYDWAYQWNDVILVEQQSSTNLYRYRDDEIVPDEIELNRNINHVMTVPETRFLVVSVYDTSFDSYVQRVELTPTNYILGTRWDSVFIGLYAPYLSPDGSQIHAVNCSWLFSYADYDTYCYESYLYADGQPTQIFAGTPIDHFPVREWDIFRLPSPSNSGVCLALTGTPDDESSGFGFWTKPQGEPGAIRSFSIRPGETVTVDATTGTWYRVTYNGQVGWMIDFALEKLDIGCFTRLDLITSDGVLLEAIYDYDLELPLLDGEESSWDTQDAKDWALTNCTGSSTITDNQNCAKVIYVVYYKIFEQIYGRVPKLSDILATTYQLELSQAPINIAEEALAGHYWAIHREYCEDMTRLRNIIIEDCPNYRIDIESFIVGYEKFGPSPADRDGGYLWTLQALYHQAVSIRDWYYGKENEPIPDRTGITDINGIVNNDRLPQLIPTVDNQVIGIRQLISGKETSPLRQWGNHAYAFVDENLRNGYENGLGELDGTYVSDTIILHCHMNVYYYGPSNAGEDIFVVIIPPNLGDTSTYNMSPISPQWVGEYSYYYPNFSEVGKTYLRCDCLENGNRYPNDRRCLRPVGSNNP